MDGGKVFMMRVIITTMPMVTKIELQICKLMENVYYQCAKVAWSTRSINFTFDLITEAVNVMWNQLRKSICAPIIYILICIRTYIYMTIVSCSLRTVHPVKFNGGPTLATALFTVSSLAKPVLLLPLVWYVWNALFPALLEEWCRLGPEVSFLFGKSCGGYQLWILFVLFGN